MPHFGYQMRLACVGAIIKKCINKSFIGMQYFGIHRKSISKLDDMEEFSIKYFNSLSIKCLQILYLYHSFIYWLYCSIRYAFTNYVCVMGTYLIQSVLQIYVKLSNAVFHNKLINLPKRVVFYANNWKLSLSALENF